MASEILKQRSERMKELKAAWKNLSDGSPELDASLREWAALYNANQSDTYQALGGEPPEQVTLITGPTGLAYQYEIK